MRKSSIWAIMLTVFFIGASIYTLYPSINLYGNSAEEQRRIINEDPQLRNRIINLGLDLQGGMRLVLEVQRNKDNQNDDDMLDRAFAIVENRVNSMGLSEPNIQKQGRDRLIVELPGLTDNTRAREVLGSTAQLGFHILRSDAEFTSAIGVVDRALRSEMAAARNDSADESENGEAGEEAVDEEQRLAERLFAGASAREEADAEEQEASVSRFSEYIFPGFRVRERDMATVMEILARQDVIDALRRANFGSSMFLRSNKATADRGMERFHTLYFVRSDAAMGGENIESAREEISNDPMRPSSPVVSLVFNNRGARDFERVTSRSVGERMAIVLDGFVYSAPTINERISLGRAQISGQFTLEEARDLAIILQAGALPAPMEIVEERVIGPSLGFDSIMRASWALLIGFILVSIFMLYRYKLSGFVAIIAVVLNVLFVLGIMAGLSATLTLPGIAGIILIVGMAIDANVLIFERIREELQVGKAPRTAIEAGYARAFRAIFDANITTIFVALILYNIGSGPIRGFALTMLIGISVSLYTALTFTKTVFRVATASGKVEKLSI